MTNKNQSMKPESLEKQANDKFPSWDMLPPFQFINPRVRQVEPKQETKSMVDSNITKPAFNPETTSTTAQVANTATNPPAPVTLEKCPACGISNEPDAEFCQECGLRFIETPTSENLPPRYIKCAHCGEELELDLSDDGIGEYNCPQCGKDFEVS